MRENYYEAHGLSSTASDREVREGFAGAIRSPQLISDVAQIGIAFAVFHRTGSKPKRSAHLRKQHVADWKYPAFAFGSVILGVVLIGASTGAHAKGAPAKSPGSALTLVLPAAESNSDTVAVPAPSRSVDEPDFISPEVIERARQRIRARASVGRFRSRSAQETPQSDAAADNGQQARALAAKLPLPNRVIARTIERIGYACGAVASATAIDGDEPGAYRVTCTSGQSYQARPVHGRYHFRRW
jgi:hypothetical protein